MPARRPVRLAVTAAAFIATAMTTASLTYAATSASTPTAVRACATSKGVLSLLSSKGNCAHGSKAVSIDQRGRTGATGKTGPRGKPGVAAPAPISIALDTTDASASSKTIAIGSTGLTVTGMCFPAADINSAVDDLVLTGTSDYYVHGSAQYLAAGTDLEARTITGSGVQTIPSGSSLIAYETDARSVIEVGSSARNPKGMGNAQLYADLVVLAGSQTFSIHMYEYFDGDRCQLSAQVVAS